MAHIATWSLRGCGVRRQGKEEGLLQYHDDGNDVVNNDHSH